MKYIVTFLIGACGYGLLEIIWRGYTHWTMTLTGGFCMLMVFLINENMPGASTAFKAMLGCGIITSVELLVGITVNIILKWNVWDYSSIPMNFMGQICLPYTILWYFLCIPVVWLCTKVATIF